MIKRARACQGMPSIGFHCHNMHFMGQKIKVDASGELMHSCGCRTVQLCTTAAKNQCAANEW